MFYITHILQLKSMMSDIIITGSHQNFTSIHSIQLADTKLQAGTKQQNLKGIHMYVGFFKYINERQNK